MADNQWDTLPPDEDSHPDSAGNSERTAKPALPATIGRYRVERLLGEGGFGVVYLAYDEQLQRSVAIKVPHAERFQDVKSINLFLQEARTAAKLEHPNILPIHDVGTSGEFPVYFVTKYIDGLDLAHFVRQKQPSFRQSAQWIHDLLNALQTAHRHGVVHRDIKPSNAILDAQGNIYLVDFGLALRDEDIGKRLPGGGTPAYMSPEQARGEGHRVDGRSDLFSLGVMFYELLAGVRPFQGKAAKENGLFPGKTAEFCCVFMQIRYKSPLADDCRPSQQNQGISVCTVLNSGNYRISFCRIADLIPRKTRVFLAQQTP